MPSRISNILHFTAISAGVALLAILWQRTTVLIADVQRMRSESRQSKNTPFQDIRFTEILDASLYSSPDGKIAPPDRGLVLLLLGTPACLSCMEAHAAWQTLALATAEHSGSEVWLVGTPTGGPPQLLDDLRGLRDRVVTATIADPVVFANRTGVAAIPLALLVSNPGGHVVCALMGIPTDAVVKTCVNSLSARTKPPGLAMVNVGRGGQLLSGP